MIRALILDFDGLILDTETALIDAYGDVHEAHGIPFERAVFTRSVGHADFSFDPWRTFGASADRDSLELERRAFNRVRSEAKPILPGVVALMDLAREASHLARLGLLDRFDFVACREDVASPKPEPDVYRLVLNRFGLGGREAIAFEDSLTGIIAAKRAGLWVAAVPNASTGHHDLSGADLCVASLADCRLPDLLARFGA
jgi:putative hydrolase of the HAD superfamily